MHSFPKPGYTRTHHKPTQFSHTRYMYIPLHVHIMPPQIPQQIYKNVYTHKVQYAMYMYINM